MEHTRILSPDVMTCLMIAVILPLISAVISLSIRDRYSWFVPFGASFLMLIAASSACYVCFSQWNLTSVIISVPWFRVGEFSFLAGMLVNNHTLMMLAIVTIISFLVHVYSSGYMAGDPGIRKYYTVLGFFTFSMLVLSVADNLLLIFCAWELVGFSSYMLIGHLGERPAASLAAKKAFIFNRVGDAGMLVGLMIILTQTATFDIHDLQVAAFSGWQTAAALCIFCGVIGKSAQFPLLTWLPDAMEGPTPVSALIHAATMVAAGIFLIVRLHFIFTADALMIVTIIGSLTALMAALSACVQYDLKKILAYSTISQLGLMVTAAGVGDPTAAMLHLFAHAFFKACLFLAAGSVIHALEHAQLRSTSHFNVQDVRNLGGLKKKLPFTFLAFVIAGSSLAGVPFFSGFLSKDAILSAIHQWSIGGTWQYIILVNAFIVSGLTVLYTFRMVWSVFFDAERKTKTLEVHESPMIMRAPIGLLMAGSFWLMISWNPFHFQGWLFESNGVTDRGESSIIVIFSAVWVLLSLVFAYSMRNRAFSAGLLFNSFYLDNIYDALIGKNTLRLATTTLRTDRQWIDGAIHFAAYVQVTIANLTGWFDRVIVDGFVNFMASIAQSAGTFIRSFQSGKVQLYVFWSIMAIVVLLIWALL